ncbi:MAG: DUF6807 family protein [Bryobacteraceae bacterium]
MKRLLLLACCALALPAADRFAYRDVSPTSLELSENGKPVYVYNYGMMLGNGAPEDRRRSGYVHPLYAPNGAVVTDDFPKDHWHHRGVSWMWPLVTIDGKTYDQWMKLEVTQKFLQWKDKKLSSNRALLAMENGWYLGDRRIAREEVEIVAHPQVGQQRDLDFTIRLTALDSPITLQGEMANKKGYGGFNIRFAPRQDTVLRTPSSKDAPDSDMQRLPWAELAATYQGKRAATRITQDSSNAGYPHGWCLRNYGFLGSNYPGLDQLVLAPGKPFTLKYRVTLSAE